MISYQSLLLSTIVLNAFSSNVDPDIENVYSRKTMIFTMAYP